MRTNLKQRSLQDIAVEKNTTCNLVIREMKQSSLNKPYKELITFFQPFRKRKLTRSEFYGLAHCVYGWMPRMIEPMQNINIQKINSELSSVGKKKTLKSGSLRETLKAFNGRIVGFSKFMHFMRPDEFAIIDKNVACSLLGNKSVSQDFWTSEDFFWAAHQWIFDYSQSPDFLRKNPNMKSTFYTCSQMRLIEFYLYTANKLRTAG
jgi:hypothetical protein